MKNLALYVHIPFCESKCSYCNFISFCLKEEKQEEYVNALINEIKLQSSSYKNYVVDTIFIGGGTPSVLKTGLLTKIFNELKTNFHIDENAEITIEANPNSITESFAKEIKDCGVNRVSVGLQSANNKLLKQINRIHTKEDFEHAVTTLKNYGFYNINADLLLGLPNQTLNDVKNSLDLLLNNNIPHISCYGLILEEGTKLYSQIQNKKFVLPSEDESNEMYAFVYEYLKEHNVFRYEVSNFSKPNYECKHNFRYWTRDNYLGLGLASYSLINNVRFNNEHNFNEYTNYYNNINNNKNIKIFNKEMLNENDIYEETIMLNLRTERGINLLEFEKQFNFNLMEKKKKEIEKLIKLDLIKVENNCLKATNSGFYVLNQIILELMN